MSTLAISVKTTENPDGTVNVICPKCSDTLAINLTKRGLYWNANKIASHKCASLN